MKNKKKNTLICGFLLLILPLAINARPITFAIGGTISHVSPSIAASFSIGQQVSGTYTFESKTPGEPFSPGGELDPSITYYPYALSSFEFLVGDYSVSLGSYYRILIFDNGEVGQDRYVVDSFNLAGSEINGMKPYSIFLDFWDSTGLIFNNGSLPLLPIKLTDFGHKAGVLDFLNGEGENRVQFEISSVSKQIPVPESPTFYLFAIGLVSLAWFRGNKLLGFRCFTANATSLSPAQ